MQLRMLVITGVFMKQLGLCSFVLLSILALPLQAQQATPTAPPQEEKILVNVADLPPTLRADIQAKQKMETYGEYARWGHEVGIAVNETLAAVTDNTAKFAETDVGKLAMFLVAWKIMAKDVFGMGDLVMGYIVGLPFFFISSLVLFWSYRKHCVPKRVLKRETIEGGKKVREYEMVTPHENSGDNELNNSQWMAAHAVVWLVLIMVSCLMMFADGGI